MKLVIVTQWVRAVAVQVPPDESLASRSGVNSTCTAQQWAYEAGGNEEAGRVMEPRNM